MKDDSFERYLAGDIDLSDLYRSSRDTVPETPDVDAAVLAAAKREAGTKPHSTRWKIRRWSVPASTAAVVVLSATLWVTNEPDVPRLGDPAPDQSVSADAIENRAEKAEPASELKSAIASDADAVRKDAAPAAKALRQSSNRSAEVTRSEGFAASAPAMKEEAFADQADIAPLEMAQSLLEAGREEEARDVLKRMLEDSPDAELPDWALKLLDRH